MQTLEAYEQTHSVSQFAWFEGCGPCGPKSAVIYQANRVHSRNGFAIMTMP